MASSLHFHKVRNIEKESNFLKKPERNTVNDCYVLVIGFKPSRIFEEPTGYCRDSFTGTYGCLPLTKLKDTAFT
jgi:hypothetical protein